jgi:hypothetical protein
MPQQEESNNEGATHAREPYRVRLPGFIIEATTEDIGVGDVIKRITSAVGIQPCGGCARRAAALNRWLVFSSRG